MCRSEKELRPGSDENVNGIREELGAIEALKSIGAEVLGEDEPREESCLEGETVPPQAVLPIHNATRRAAKVTSDRRTAF
jgi:hypothetical protein